MEFWGHFSSEVLAGLSVALLSTLVFFLYKLPRTLSDLNGFMQESKLERKEHEARLEIHDALWSAELLTNVDTKLIAKGDRPFPIRVKKPREH